MSVKKIFFIVVLIVQIGGGITFAQNPLVKTYGYSRLVIPGKARIEMKIGGVNPEKEKVLPKTEYYFFIEINGFTDSVICNMLWIKGKRYALQNQVTVQTPVKLSVLFSADQIKELVPATNNRVIQFWPGLVWKKQLIKNKCLKKLVQSNQVVIQVLINKKIYYAVIKKIKQLPELAEV
ncbi:MAG TPA: hypothetical protein VFN30_13225 [Chitinophagaceae bacterium]|nr:hypothetical protein [Chitinophagaceae bacterium]